MLTETRVALRSLRHNPAYSLVALLSLALGIGANAVVITGVYCILVRPLPFERLEQLVHVSQTAPVSGEKRNASLPDFRDWQERAGSFQALGASRWWPANVTGGGDPERVVGYQVTSGFFPCLRVHASAGRFFSAEEYESDEPRVTVVSHGFWQRRLGSDSGVVGRSITLNDAAYQVIGIMPADLDYPVGADLWVPLPVLHSRLPRSAHDTVVYGRLRDGVSVGQARDEMTRLASVLARDYPETNAGWGSAVEELRLVVTEGPRQFVLVLWAGAAFVLLLACANVANLHLARAAAREKEVAVRYALGATRWQVTRLLLQESVLLGVGGTVLGILLAVWGLDAWKAALPPDVLRFGASARHIQLNYPVLLCTAVLGVLCGIVTGLVPAGQKIDVRLNEALKQGGSRVTSSRMRLRSALVISEVALAMILVLGAGVMVRGFRQLAGVDRGFDANGLLTLQMNLGGSGPAQGARAREFFEAVLERLRAGGPGVQAAAGSVLPALGNSQYTGFSIEGRPAPRPNEAMDAEIRIVSDDYFPTMRIPIRSGRVFSRTDGPSSAPVALISESLARQYWGGQNPLGHRLAVEDGRPATIVGVVGDVSMEWFRNEVRPTIYLPFAQSPQGAMYVIVRTKGEPELAVAAARAAVRAVDPKVPVYEAAAMRRRLNDQASGVRLSAGTMAALAVVALILAITGIYAVVAYLVAQRTHEIGVRVALGARPADVLSYVLHHAGRLVLWGLGIGLPGAIALSRVMSGFLFGVPAVGVVLCSALALGLAGVALLAAYLPARRATRIDPMEALRVE